MTELPAHEVGSRWLWLSDSGKPGERMTVTKVTKNTVTMKHDKEGWTVQFREKRKAFSTGKLVRQ